MSGAPCHRSPSDVGLERSADTTADAAAKQLEALRALGVEGRARLTFSLMDDATELALAGIRAREPQVSNERERWLLMAYRYGRELAVEVLGDEPSL